MNRARSAARTMSQPRARLQPAPAATPFTAATVGLGRSWRRSAHPADEAHVPHRRPDARGRGTGRGIGEVSPRAEAVTLARDDEHAVVQPVGDLVEHREELAPHRAVDRVLLVGAR